MKNTNVLLIFIILAIIFAALWVGSSNNKNSSPETVYTNRGSYPIPVPIPIPFSRGGHHGGGGHHHQHNLGPGGELQPIHTHVITNQHSPQ